MSVRGITSLRAALTTGVFQMSMGRQTAAETGQTSTTIGSAIGPSATVVGPTQNFAQGLYNAFGQLLSSATLATTSASQSADKKRAGVLESAAAKISQGDTSGGRAEAQGLLGKNANDVDAIRLVAASHLFENDYKQAERRFAQAAALNPANPALQDDVAFVRTLDKSDDDVLAVARRKVKSQTQRTEGLRLLKHLTDRSPDNADAFLAMADGFAAARQPVQVLGALQEALRSADDSQTGEVVAQARELVEQHPQVGSPRNLLGRALQKDGRLDDAVVELRAAADIVPANLAFAKDVAGAHAERALSRLEDGNTSGALMDVHAASAIAPVDPGVAEATARVAAEEAKQDITRGHYNRALTKLSVATRKAPDDARFKKELSGEYIQLAIRFDTNGDDTQALASYSKAYELDPNSTTARRKVAELSYSEGLVAVGANDYDRAITLFQAAYDTYRASTSYGEELAKTYDLRGQQNVTLKKYDLAVQDFERGIAVDPTNTSLGSNFASAIALQAGS